jgi:urocanate hydratase
MDFGLCGAELALATTLAGGTFLGIDPSADHLKAAVRNGSCDFMVNTLDESLRTLKNELRKRTALSVGLLASASEILPAMVERGIQPDWIADASPEGSEAAPAVEQALLSLVERGAWNMDAQAANSAEHSTRIEVTWTAADAADLKCMDGIALERLPSEDQVRRRWLRQAAGCFHRQLPLQRVLGLRPEELSQLMDAFQDSASNGKIQKSASVHWLAAKGEKQTILLQPR